MDMAMFIEKHLNTLKKTLTGVASHTNSILFLIFNLFSLLTYSQVTHEIELLNNKSSINRIFNIGNKIDATANFTDTLNIKVDSLLIEVKIEYKNGQKVSAIGFYKNGNMYRECYFQNLKKTGYDIIRYENSQMMYLTYFVNGVAIEPTMKWYESGEVEALIYSDSHSFSWYKNGNFREKNSPIKGTINGFDSKSYYKNGNIETECKNNIGKALQKTYYPSGELLGSGYIINSQFTRVGEWKEWYKSGTLKKRYCYSDEIANIPDGVWSHWDENGELIKQEVYQLGKLIDEKTFIPNNNKAGKR